MDIEQVAEILKNYAEDENLKYMLYPMDSSRIQTLFEDGIEGLDNGELHGGLLEMKEAFLNNPKEYIEREFGDEPSFDAVAILLKSHRNVRTDVKMDSIPAEDIIGAVSLKSLEFVPNSQSRVPVDEMTM